ELEAGGDLALEREARRALADALDLRLAVAPDPAPEVRPAGDQRVGGDRLRQIGEKAQEAAPRDGLAQLGEQPEVAPARDPIDGDQDLREERDRDAALHVDRRVTGAGQERL